MQEVAVPEVLYEEVIEVDERVVLRQGSCRLPRKDATTRVVTGVRNASIPHHILDRTIKRCLPYLDDVL